MNPFSILMFAFSGMLLLYAAFLAVTKDEKLIPRGYAAAMKDKRAYTAVFAKAIALVALAPMGGGIYGLAGTRLGLIMMLVGFIDCVWISTYFFKGLTA